MQHWQGSFFLAMAPCRCRLQCRDFGYSYWFHPLSKWLQNGPVNIHSQISGWSLTLKVVAVRIIKALALQCTSIHCQEQAAHKMYRLLHNLCLKHFWHFANLANMRKMSSFFTFMWPCIVTNFFVIKPTRCTNFTNLFCYETLHVSDSSSVHHQGFILCTFSNGICHTGL